MLKNVANIVRGLSADAVEKANSGHPGMPIGCAEIGSLLYGEVMKHDPGKPDWPNRDRFILSAGHGSMLIYSLLHLSGYDLSVEDLKDFRQLDSKTPGHPEYGYTPGVETTTGPLGQGFANALGMAVSERMLAERYNTDNYSIVDHYTYTLLGDGCMMEGVVAEAASLAGHLGLGKLIAIYDDNEISIEGSTDITFTESVADRFEAYNWHVIDNVDGHDLDALRRAIEDAKAEDGKPTLIIANTHIAYGAPTKQDSASSHGAPLGKDETEGLKEEIGLPTDKKFYVSDEVREYFEGRKEELVQERKRWEETFAKWAEENPELKESWDTAHNLELPEDLQEVVEGLEIDTPIATRKASGATLRTVADHVPYLVGGSADLGPSNKTYLDKYEDIQSDNFDGRNLRFGVREHAMGSMVNGISLHQGLRPFCATFLIFSDYMRPAIRMAALMKQPVIYVFTHDSVYIGEDGPTHQPVEQVESLRLIPNLNVIRPGDAEEAKAAWLMAMERTDGPTALILTRQNVDHIEKVNGLSGAYKGGYVVSKEEGDQPDLVLMASGSEVTMAQDVATILREKGKDPRIVSIPDRTRFISQDESYINEVLGPKDAFRVVIEAGRSQGWYRLLRDRYEVFSVETFGESAPGNEVASECFGFDAEKIAEKLLKSL